MTETPAPTTGDPGDETRVTWQAATGDAIGIPSVELARLSAAYWGEAAVSSGQRRLRDFAMDVVDYLAMLVSRDEPGGNWEALYDTWLSRASMHAADDAALWTAARGGE